MEVPASGFLSLPEKFVRAEFAYAILIYRKTCGFERSLSRVLLPGQQNDSYSYATENRCHCIKLRCVKWILCCRCLLIQYLYTLSVDGGRKQLCMIGPMGLPAPRSVVVYHPREEGSYPYILPKGFCVCPLWFHPC